MGINETITLMKKIPKDLLQQDIELKPIKDEIESIQQRINIYENPEDLTLMFMYCDEKAKDKIKDLQQRIDKAKNKINSMFNNGDENTIIDVENKAKVIGYMRLLRRCLRRDADEVTVNHYKANLSEALDKVDTLVF